MAREWVLGKVERGKTCKLTTKTEYPFIKTAAIYSKGRVCNTELLEGRHIRIITVNLPVSYLKAIDSLTGHEGLYPSRSELIRVAVRDFLIRELEAAKSFQKYQQAQVSNKIKRQKVDEELFVQVPLNENSVDGITEYKTYRLVKK